MKNLIVSSILVFGFSWAVYAQSVDDFEYEVNDQGGVTITRYDVWAISNPTIPSKLGGRTVTEVGDGAFSNRGLTSIIIPSTVSYIGDYAFRNNKLTRVNIPSGISYIGDHAFANNKLTSVNIPSGISYIGEGAFGNNELTSITLPNGTTEIKAEVFAMNQLTSITIPKSVVKIEDGAFYDNKITSVNIPNGVKTIGDMAFAENSLTSITIGDGVDLEDTRTFSKAFFDYYNANGKKAGTYTKNGTNWILDGKNSATGISNNEPKKIQISNFNGRTFLILLLTKVDGEITPIAGGRGSLDSDGISGYIMLELYNITPDIEFTNTQWTGNGKFTPMLYVDGKFYMYTKGDGSGNLPQLSVTEAITKISADQFTAAD
jgi:hypothetical protein